MLKKYWPLIIFLIFYIVVTLLTYKSYGISMDEPETYYRGKLLYIKTRGNDKILQKDFVIEEEIKQNDLLDHNHFHHALLYIINGKEKFETYHLLNLLFAITVYIFSYVILLKNLRKPFLAILGPIFIFFTPRFFGDSPANPTDIPFAVYFFASICLIYLSEKWDPRIKILILGVCFGLAQAMRIIGYSLYVIYFIYYFFTTDIKNKKEAMNFLLELLIIFLISYLVHIITLPFLGADPFNHIFYLFGIAVKYPWKGKILFNGNFFDAKNLSFFYLPTWFLITTPIFILVLTFSSIFFLNKKNKLQFLLLITLGFNLFIFYFTKPVIYDGIRHFSYFLPLLVVLSVINFSLFSKKISKFLIILIFINLLFIGKEYFRLFPYQYTYFNEIIGGLKGAYDKYETDYWATSNIEAAMWIKKNIIDNKLKIYVCGNEAAVKYYLPEISAVRDYKIANYAICGERLNKHKEIKGKIIYTVSREGVPLTHIFKITK